MSAANELEVETVLFLYTKVGIVPKSTLRKENTIFYNNQYFQNNGSFMCPWMWQKTQF